MIGRESVSNTRSSTTDGGDSLTASTSSLVVMDVVVVAAAKRTDDGVGRARTQDDAAPVVETKAWHDVIRDEAASATNAFIARMVAMLLTC